MPTLIWWIVGVVFGAPVLILLALFAANRLGKGHTGKTINILWLILAIMLILFLGFAVFGRAA